MPFVVRHRQKKPSIVVTLIGCLIAAFLVRLVVSAIGRMTA
jgi:hypothetical protein